MRICLNQLTKQYGTRTVVDHVDLDIESGSLVALLGPSGCGKTTILGMIAGLTEQSSGSVFFGDRNMDDAPIEKRNIGMVFQNYALYPHMTVADNLGFPLTMRRTHRREIKRRVLEIATFLRLDSLLSKKPSQLSGGEQQRVAIGRALIKEPAVLLMDEPLSNLDKQLRVQTRDEIRRIQRELGITTIFVTHDQEEATAIADRIVLLRDGRVQQYDSPYGLYSDPSNRFVAEFIGSVAINLIQARCENGIVRSSWFDISDAPPSDFQVGTVGVRPEDFILCNESGYQDVGVFSGMIRSIQNFGRDLLVRLGTREQFCQFYAPGDASLQVGDRVSLRVKPNRLLYFDASGVRVKDGRNVDA